ncbi:MAG: hypothetical protein IK133_02630 [Clostridia bacterium]|nr:hypothetical protein [Clostridia bacterium]
MTKLYTLLVAIILLLSAAVSVRAEGAAEVQVGDYLVFGHYDQDNNKRNPAEPVEWQVLDVKDGKAMIISRHGLEVCQYDRLFYYPTWEKSQVRRWLNSTFLNKIFTAEEQACVEITHLVTLDNSLWVDYRKATGRDYEEVNDVCETDDMLFLLSTEEVLQLCGLSTIQEQLDSAEAKEMMKATPTRHAEYAGAFVYHGSVDEFKLDGVGCCWWMLRSPGHLRNHLAYVGTGGNLNSYFYTDVHRLDVCIRPVCWVNLAALQALSN